MFKTFGNIVRIKRSEATAISQTADKIGEIFGETKLSVSCVEVIGTPKSDYAVNVYFKDIEKSLWFDEELLEFVSNGEGSVMTIGNISFTKNKSGDWIITDENNISQTKRWWQFWRN